MTLCPYTRATVRDINKSTSSVCQPPPGRNRSSHAPCLAARRGVVVRSSQCPRSMVVTEVVDRRGTATSIMPTASLVLLCSFSYIIILRPSVQFCWRRNRTTTRAADQQTMHELLTTTTHWMTGHTHSHTCARAAAGRVLTLTRPIASCN